MTYTVESDAPLTRWDVPCPTCKAQPGQPCRRPNGDKAAGYHGEPKFHAARKGRVIPPECQAVTYCPTGPYVTLGTVVTMTPAP